MDNGDEGDGQGGAGEGGRTYFLAILQEHRAASEASALMETMERKQPGNTDVRDLSRFLRGGP